MLRRGAVGRVLWQNSAGGPAAHGQQQATVTVALVVCLTMAITVLLAKTVGCILPITAKRLGFDPAVMASPFITTIVDALSLLVYFGIAKVLLGV